MSSHDWEMLIRLLLAAFLGGIVGIERGSGDRPAGFRTHILVCAGAAGISAAAGKTFFPAVKSYQSNHHYRRRTNT